MVRKQKKKHVCKSMEPVAKKRFVEEIQKRHSTMDPKKRKNYHAKADKITNLQMEQRRKKILHKCKEKY